MGVCLLLMMVLQLANAKSIISEYRKNEHWIINVAFVCKLWRIFTGLCIDNNFRKNWV